MNLYKLILRATHSQYSPCFVVAEDPTSAYNKVRQYLDEKDYFFRSERELESIELIASADETIEIPALFISCL